MKQDSFVFKTAIVCACLCAMVSGTVSAQASDSKKQETSSKSDLVPLELELPKFVLIGTEKDIKSNNLEKKRKGKRPPFMVPKGTVNLALKKRVSGSDDFPIIGEMGYVTDGDKEGTHGSSVEFGPGLQHVQIDLEKTSKIHAVVIWHFFRNTCAFKDVVVQVCNDPDFIKPTTIFNNDHNNSAGLGRGKDKEYIESYEGRIIKAGGVEGRYVRLYSNGSTADDINHYIEVEVYGKPVPRDSKQLALTETEQ